MIFLYHEEYHANIHPDDEYPMKVFIYWYDDMFLVENILAF